ncbi:hypothetical protein [Serratia rubidaea]|uniref:hypothetical protein n=1 Tax=Serratia rubidaea TaxID=61652 RepID=UPI0007738FD5|nr:hypothetical protein [Serratia rubidaea]
MSKKRVLDEIIVIVLFKQAISDILQQFTAVQAAQKLRQGTLLTYCEGKQALFSSKIMGSVEVKAFVTVRAIILTCGTVIV